VDLDINYKASQYVGGKCEMALFNPNALPPTLLGGIRPIINRQNVINSFEYKADLLSFEGCCLRSQTSDFQSYLEAPPTANPPTKVMIYSAIPPKNGRIRPTSSYRAIGTWPGSCST
jgi:hypothetical protein